MDFRPGLLERPLRGLPEATNPERSRRAKSGRLRSYNTRILDIPGRREPPRERPRGSGGREIPREKPGVSGGAGALPGKTNSAEGYSAAFFKIPSNPKNIWLAPAVTISQKQKPGTP